MQDLVLIVSAAIKIVEKVSIFIKDNFEKVTNDQIEIKEHNSLVSYVDKQAEKQLVSGLSKILPESGFITEEDTPNDPDKPYTWIIDPLDGTTNYLHGIPYFSISIALSYKGVLLLGIVKDVMIGDLFYAIKDGGAFRNGNPLKIRERKLSDSLVATGFPYTNSYNIEGLFDKVKHWLMEGRGIRRFGSAALDMCYVAASRTQAYYETSLNAWDLAAGAIIVREAGGIVTDIDGSDRFLETGNIIASGKELYDEVKRIVGS